MARDRSNAVTENRPFRVNQRLKPPLGGKARIWGIAEAHESMSVSARSTRLSLIQTLTRTRILALQGVGHLVPVASSAFGTEAGARIHPLGAAPQTSSSDPYAVAWPKTFN